MWRPRGGLIRILFAKLIDQFVRDDPAARSERPQTIDCLGFLCGMRFRGRRQSTPGQVRNHRSDGLFFALRPLLGGLKHVIGNVERRSHASDASASRIRCLAAALPCDYTDHYVYLRRAHQSLDRGRSQSEAQSGDRGRSNTRPPDDYAQGPARRRSGRRRGVGAQNSTRGYAGGFLQGLPVAGFWVEHPALEGSIASHRPVRYLLDTNVVSEWTKPRPNVGVIEWLAQVDEDEVFLSVVTFAETVTWRHNISRRRIASDRGRKTRTALVRVAGARFLVQLQWLRGDTLPAWTCEQR